MKKKRVISYLFVLSMLLVLPVTSANTFVTDQPSSGLLTGYMLIHVTVFTLGEGLRPYAGANITMRGFLYTYKGTTDEQGDCLFQVHTHLLRGKRYVIKVSIHPADWLHTKINSLIIEPREIMYKDFLFIVLKDIY